MTGEVKDPQAEAITLHDRSMVVTAGAGTGKTYVLVHKYIDLIETQGVTVPEILALTFTDKAAAEMKERIRKEISKRKGTTWEKAGEDFMVAPVHTFHSFCAQVLREFPVEAGLEPGFVVLDAPEASRILARAYETLVHTPHEGPAKQALVNALACIEQRTLQKMLVSMYGKRDQYARFFSSLDEDEPSLLAFWQREVHAFRDGELDRLRKDPGFHHAVEILLNLAAAYEGVDDKAVQFLWEIRPFLQQLSGCTEPEPFCLAAKGFLARKPGNTGSKKNWDENDLAAFRSVRRALEKLLDGKKFLFRLTAGPDSPLVAGSIRLLHDLSLVFNRYLELVEDEKAVRGGVDFSDLIYHARRLFAEKPELVATHFMQRFRYILVDEFQDTDPAQFDIVLSIAGELTPSTNCLFIVGDPKQSIYLFREVDVTRFKSAQQLIDTTCKGRVLNLETSYRSTKEVIGLTNLLFGALFSSAEKPWEFGYKPIKTSDKRKDHHGRVELMLSSKAVDLATTKRNEAGMVAKRIHGIVNATPLTVYEELPDRTFKERPAGYGDIAILLEKRTNLSYYLSALSRSGIPYHVHGGTGFYGRQEVFDLYNLLRFLENRYDDVSLFGVLRSPYFGLSDAELFHVAQERGSSLWNKLARYSDSTGSIPATRARDLLSGWQEQAGRSGLAPLIRRMVYESGVYTVYGTLPEGEQILANIEKLVAMARSREEPGNYSLEDFTTELAAAMDEDEREGEAALDTLTGNAVNVMTVHAAKGLEFPIVFVPDMGMTFENRFAPIMIGEDPRLVGIMASDPDDDYKSVATPVLTMLREIQGQKERAEKKRVLYVALTRARDHLFMSGTRPETLVLSPDSAENRVQWVFSGLGITGDNIAEGFIALHPEDGPEPLRLTISTDITELSIEQGDNQPELIEVPGECAHLCGRFSFPVHHVEPGVEPVYTVSQIENYLDDPAGEKGKYRRKLGNLPQVNAGLTGSLRGTVIHEVLRGRDPRAVCREYNVSEQEFINQCTDIDARFRDSPFMKRVSKDLCEVPFEATVYDTRFKGSIDRLCELDDGTWAVIDYKSDPVSPGSYSQKEEKYAIQMAVYIEAARQIVKKSVVGYLYFTETGDFHRVQESGDLVSEQVRKAVMGINQSI